MKQSSKYILLLCVLLYSFCSSKAQNKVSLDEVLSQVIQNSYAVKSANYQKTIAELSYENFNTQLKPSINLFGNLPNYNKTSFPVVQPNGNLAFQSIRQANSAFQINASQVIPATGGTVFINSNLQRFDDFRPILNNTMVYP